MGVNIDRYPDEFDRPGDYEPVREEVQWCPLRGLYVPHTDCVNSCADEAQRDVCWMGRRVRGNDDE